MSVAARLKELENRIFDFCGVVPDHPFKETDLPVFRRPDSRKWFAVVIPDVPGRYFGKSGKVTVLNLKCDPLLSDGICDGVTVFPAYHMNKRHWISVVLNEDPDLTGIMALVSVSYRLTMPARKKSKEESHD